MTVFRDISIFALILPEKKFNIISDLFTKSKSVYALSGIVIDVKLHENRRKII